MNRQHPRMHAVNLFFYNFNSTNTQYHYELNWEKWQTETKPLAWQ